MSANAVKVAPGLLITVTVRLIDALVVKDKAVGVKEVIEAVGVGVNTKPPWVGKPLGLTVSMKLPPLRTEVGRTVIVK